MSDSDDAYRLLHRASLTIGDTAFSRPPGVAWRVSGHNGKHLIRAEERTRDEAWQAAVGQARALGMVGE